MPKLVVHYTHTHTHDDTGIYFERATLQRSYHHLQCRPTDKNLHNKL